jgi:hypothetical protein
MQTGNAPCDVLNEKRYAQRGEGRTEQLVTKREPICNYSISRRCGAALLCISTHVKMHVRQAKLRYILDCTPQHCCPLPRSETSAEFMAAVSDCVHVCV